MDQTKLIEAMQKLGKSGYAVQKAGLGEGAAMLRVNGRLMNHAEVLELAEVQDDDNVRWVGYGPPEED